MIKAKHINKQNIFAIFKVIKSSFLRLLFRDSSHIHTTVWGLVGPTVVRGSLAEEDITEPRPLTAPGVGGAVLAQGQGGVPQGVVQVHKACPR